MSKRQRGNFGAINSGILLADNVMRAANTYKRLRGGGSLGFIHTYDRRRYRVGRRPRKNVRQLWKRAKQGMDAVVYRWQGMNKFDSLSVGYCPLAYRMQTGGTTAHFPLHLFNLTGRPNYVRDIPTGTSTFWTPMPAYVLTGPTGSTGNFAWSYLGGQGANGSSGSHAGYKAWQLEHSDHAVTNNAPLSGDTLDWVQAKIMLYGTNTTPTKFMIDVVQFMDDTLYPQTYGTDWPVVDPPVNTYDPGAPTEDVKGTRERNQFWQSMVKPLVYSPLVVGNYGEAKVGKKMKIIRSMTHMINPTSLVDTTSGAGTPRVIPNMRQVELFIRFNRNQNYDYEGRVQVDPDDASYVQTIQNTINIDVKPKARIFLMLRALCPDSGQDAPVVENATITGTGYSGQGGAVYYTPILRDGKYIQPSYDIVIRKKHSKIAFR